MQSISVSDAPDRSSWGQVVELDPRFGSMIGKLERAASRNPGRYRHNVVMAGLLGYGVLCGILLFFIGLTLLMVVMMFTTHTALGAEAKGVMVFGAISFALLRAMWTERPAPDGIAIAREEASDLFALIDRTRKATGGPAVHEVRITDQLNAAITQDTRFLALGGTNTLYIGLPLLYAMRTIEIEAIIAHEFGHFVGRHGRSAGFAYRVRQRWAQTAERLPTGLVAGGLRRFFAWYGPWFAAYSFVLARQHEYEADRVSARVAGAEVAADALVRINVQAGKYNEVWSTIWSQAPVRDDPPSSPFYTVAAALTEELADDDEIMQRALTCNAAIDDTHPTLSQRLDALGQSPRLPPELKDTAARDLLGDMEGSIRHQFDAQWHAWADEAWAGDYQRRQEDRAERLQLQDEIAAGDCSRDKMFRVAWLTELIDGPASGAAAYQSMLDRYPDAHDARYRQGDCLLESGDEQGTALLLQAIDAEPALQIHAHRRIISFLLVRGRAEEAKVHSDLLEAAEEQASRVSAEAQSIDASVDLRSIDPETAARLAELAGTIDGVKSLHAAVRDLQTAPQPQIVFIFEPEKGLTGQEVLDVLIDALLPAGDLFGIERSRKRRWLAKRIEGLPNSKII